MLNLIELNFSKFTLGKFLQGEDSLATQHQQQPGPLHMAPEETVDTSGEETGLRVPAMIIIYH